MWPIELDSQFSIRYQKKLYDSYLLLFYLSLNCMYVYMPEYVCEPRDQKNASDPLATEGTGRCESPYTS